MTTDPQDTRRKQFLLANLIILTLLVFGLIFVLAAYPIFIAPEPTAMPTITNTFIATAIQTQAATSSLTPTITRTPRLTFTPTETGTPTITTTPIPPSTPIGPPTLTAAWPLNNNLAYELPLWTAGKAQNLIQLMDNYPNTLDLGKRGEDNAHYYDAYEFAVIAQQEALMRFLDAPQGDQWRWGLAYNLARTGDPGAGEIYAQLLVSALNRGETDLGGLKSWFIQHEPRMEFSIVELDPITGYINNYLVALRGNGGAFIRLLESSSGFSASVMNADFDFVSKIRSNWILSDLSGDVNDGQEVAFYDSNPTGEFQVQPPVVLNLGDKPEQKLPFVPDKNIFNIGLEYDNNWVVRSYSDGKNRLAFETTVYPLCPVTLLREYVWDGNVFSFTGEDYKVNPPLETLYLCDYIVQHAEQFWGPQAGAQLREMLLPEWPPVQDAEGKAYPLDAADEWSYRMAVNLALLGESKLSKEILSGIISNPSVPNSRWTTQAQEFLDIYKLPEDIYKACINAEDCDAQLALQSLIEQVPPQEIANISEYFQDWQVNILGSGFFDFEEDSEPERWVTLRHRPLEKIEFWILGTYPGGVKALNIGTVDSNPPDVENLDEAFLSEEAIETKTAVFVDGKYSFTVNRIPGTREPYITPVPLRKEYPDHFENGLKSAEKKLFDGVDPGIVQRELKDLQIWPGLLCEPEWTCDRYYYMLGLASELYGDEREAVDAYLKLWRDYSKSPFTTMARLKLEGPASQLTITPIFSPTSTSIFITSTPGTVTATPSQTPTITGTILATSTPSATTLPYP